MFDFNTKITPSILEEFAESLKEESANIGFKVSSRGWCYIMEQNGSIDKSQFDKVDSLINRCRKEGYLPVDFVAEEDARAFSCIEEPSTLSIEELLKKRLEYVIDGHYFYTPDWWVGEEHYIQVLVEKIDLKTLFEPICENYHIPIANAKGWSSILQRAEYCRRFKEMENRGLQCVLLYCGDHDPAGLQISDTIRTNLRQIQEILWEDGEEGYDPSDLIIKRFGLNYDFIISQNFTWIDNLITGSGKDLDDPKHRNFKSDYVVNYKDQFGSRKCEANAIVTSPHAGRNLFRDEIKSWLGEYALDRFEEKTDAVKEEFEGLLAESGLLEPIQKFLDEN